MNEITIAVKYDNDNPTVSGRELHAALEVQTPYRMWFPRMCEYGFTENVDYSVTNIFVHHSKGGSQGYIDHQLTIDMAKELCMIQRTEIGKCCREYFINLEKQWNSPDAVMARALQIADQKLELAKQQNGSLIETTAVQAKQIEVMKPKADYCDMVLHSEGLMPITTIAKDYGKSAKWLNKWLHEHGIQYKQGQIWLLYQKYADRGYMKSKTHTVYDKNGDPTAKIHSYWTQQGRIFIYDQLKKDGILPLIEKDDSLNAVGSIRSTSTAYGVPHTPPCFERRLMCRRELLFLGVGAANSTSIFGHKNNRQTMYYSILKTEYETSTLFVFYFFLPERSVHHGRNC